MKFLRLFAVIFACLFFSGCASVVQKKEMSSFNNLYCEGNYVAAAESQVKALEVEKLKKSELLQGLQAAASLRAANQLESSTKIFDKCEEVIKEHNEKLLASNVASNLGAMLVNDAVLDYQGTEYDGIMVNTYKALNFWQMGDMELARVEFNRALDRQRRAKERFAAEIKKQKEAVRKKQEEDDKAKGKGENSQSIDFAKNLNNPEIDEIIKEKYSNLSEFNAYPDFVNPLTTYMASLFFMADGDISKASGLMKEVYGMAEQNRFVKGDFRFLEDMAGGTNKQKKYTWIVFENGLSPELEEFRVDLPLFLFTEDVKYTGIALPKLKIREKAYDYLVLKIGKNEIAKTETLASMDRVIQTEFKKRYPGIVTRSVVSALLKTYGQYAAQKKLGGLGGFAAGLYQAASTSADIRMWTALPKEFQLAKIDTPADGFVEVAVPGADLLNIEIPKDSSSLVYIKMPVAGATPVYDIIRM